MERNEKDEQTHNTEMKELQRIISHDDRIKEFMMIKGSDRAELKAEEAQKRLNMKGRLVACVFLPLSEWYCHCLMHQSVSLSGRVAVFCGVINQTSFLSSYL